MLHTFQTFNEKACPPIMIWQIIYVVHILNFMFMTLLDESIK